MQPIRPIKLEVPSINAEGVKFPEKKETPESPKKTESEIMAVEDAVKEEKGLAVVPPPSVQTKSGKDPELKKIEDILTEHIQELFVGLPDDIKPKFKKRGEETAVKIQKALSTAKHAAGKILRLIRKWLSMVPGVSKYFLEQESKIKTDQLLKLREKK